MIAQEDKLNDWALSMEGCPYKDILIYIMHINYELMKINRHILDIEICIHARHDNTI